MNLAIIRRMYVLEYKSTTEIAQILGKPRRTVNFVLHQMGVELRSRTNRRTCKIPACGKECFKRVVSNGRRAVLSGSMCREHDREYWRLKSLARRRKDKAGAVQDKRFLGKELSTSPHFVYSNTQGLADEQREAL